MRLLKLLEEPPANSLLVLVNHAPGRVPVTIRSRCRRLKLLPLERPDLEDLLAAPWTPTLNPRRRRLPFRWQKAASAGRSRSPGVTGLAVLREAAGLLEGEPALDRQALNAVTERWIRQSSGEGATPLAERLELVLWWAGQGTARHGRGRGSRGDAGRRDTLRAADCAPRAGRPCGTDRQGGPAGARGPCTLRLNPKQIAMTLFLTLAE